MVYLITGSNGLLRQKLLQKLKNIDCEIIATSKGENKNPEIGFYKYENLDITNKPRVFEVVNKYKPNGIINTAALTNVDLCEDEKELCDHVNSIAVGYLADVALEVNAHLIHISTDFIFDGEDGPYKEEDTPNPLSYYGLSKLKSEELLYKHNVDWTILRTIIVFGVAENLSKGNIVLWAKGALAKGDPLNIIDDQFRAPTLAEDLADACILAAKKKALGVFNASGKDIMSIYEIVERIAKHYGNTAENLNKLAQLL